MIELRTSAWYGDHALPLSFPDDWRITTHWPKTPAPLSDAEMAEALERPVGRPPLRDFARGTSRPVIVVDDLTRPTPADRVLPALLRELEEAGHPRERITIVLASGAHGRIPAVAIEKKVGREAATACRLVVHDASGQAVNAGRTSFGTRVLVNPEVAAADLVVGVGGTYPQHSTGFGGGSKLALGVLAKRSIVRLHYRHGSVGGSYAIDNPFRRDLDEIARLIGLSWTVNVNVDARREPVRVVCGDHERYYPDAVNFSRRAYRAPLPGDADLVIANAYPVDVSLTFMRIKGIIPLLRARPKASRVVIASCPEGVGLHEIFPFMNGFRFSHQLAIARAVIHRPRSVAAAATARVRRLHVTAGSATHEPHHRIWLFAPGRKPGSLPAAIPGMTALYRWSDVLDQIVAEQGAARRLSAAIYPCAPLHVLEPDEIGSAATSAGRDDHQVPR